LKLIEDTCKKSGWPYDKAKAEKAFKDADLNEDGRIDSDELLKTLHDIFILYLEIAKEEKEANDELKRYDCLKDNKDLKALIDLVGDKEDMKKVRDGTMDYYDTEKKGSLDHD